jgi:hypothetical protein
VIDGGGIFIVGDEVGRWADAGVEDSLYEGLTHFAATDDTEFHGGMDSVWEGGGEGFFMGDADEMGAEGWEEGQGRHFFRIILDINRAFAKGLMRLNLK